MTHETDEELIQRIAPDCFDLATDGRGRKTFSADEYGVRNFAQAFHAAKLAQMVELEAT